MNLFRSMCCLFGGRCAEDQPKPPTNAMSEVSGDLGQREAEREKASKDQLGHGRRCNHQSGDQGCVRRTETAERLSESCA
jgi:hypothetical protein